MNLRNLLSFLFSLCLVVAIGLTGCTNHEQKVLTGGDAAKINDSIIEQAMDMNLDSALQLIDSLERNRTIPGHKANYYRGQIHYRLGQELSAELYFKRALNDGELLQERPVLYYYVSDQLSTILTVKGDQAGAIDIATNAYSVIQTDTTQEGHYWSAILLHDIGYSQMQLGHKLKPKRISSKHGKL